MKMPFLLDVTSEVLLVGLIALLISCGLVGCPEKEGRPIGAQCVPAREGELKVIHEVTWSDYSSADDDPFHAVFILDGENLGVGKAGFRRLLSRLRDLPLRSDVLVYPDSHFFGLILYGDSGYHANQTFFTYSPIRAVGEWDDAFRAVIGDRKMQCKVLPGRPGEFKTSHGEEVSRDYE